MGFCRLILVGIFTEIYVRKLRYEFTESNGAKDTFEIYANNILECKMHELEVISSDDNMALNMPIFEEIMSIPNIETIFRYPNLAFYNVSIVQGMVNEQQVPLAIDYSISFESNTARYLHDYLEGRKVEESFIATLHVLLEKNYNLDPMFYMIESLAKENNTHEFYNNLFSIKKLMTCDKKYYYKTGKIKSIFDDSKIENIIQKELHYIQTTLYKVIETAQEQQLVIKIVLLAMVYARFKYGSEKQQIKYLINFMAERLKSILLREFIIAINYLYYENNKDQAVKKNQKDRYKFFNPLNTGIKDKFFLKLDGMAWDLTLVRQLEMYFSSKPNPDADFFIPFLFTYDKGLLNIMEMFYVKDFLIFHKEKRTVPLFANNHFDFNKINEYGLDEYFTEEAMVNRLNSKDVDLKKIYEELKGDFIDLGRFKEK